MRLPVFASCLLLLASFGAAAEEAATPRTSDLVLRVLPTSEACAEAEPCSLALHVLNEGQGPYEGPLSVYLDLHAPAVLPAGSSSTCQREDYGKFRCQIEDMSLEPGGYLVIEPQFLFVATALESSKACASLEWNRQTLAQRDRLLSEVIEASGHTTAGLMKAAGLSGDASRSRLLAALLGRWGEGDAAAANDTGCATIGIVSEREGAQCAAGEARIGGACTALTQWCPSNRRHMSTPDRCACPDGLANWNSDTGTCEAGAPKLACATPDADPTNSCRCPLDRPVFNAAKASCVAVEKAVAAVEPPPEPVQPKKAAPVEEPVEEPEEQASEPEEQVSEPPVKSDKAAVKTRKPVRTVSVEPRRKTSTANRRTASTRVSRSGRRCRALQVWGPHLNRCIPLPIYLMGRLFAPNAERGRCPAGYHAVNGRCRR